jgi:hypothetical protein
MVTKKSVDDIQGRSFTIGREHATEIFIAMKGEVTDAVGVVSPPADPP